MATIFKRGKILWIAWYQQGKVIRKWLKLIDTRENRKIADQIRLEKELELSRKQFAKATNNILFSDAVYFISCSINILLMIKENGENNIKKCNREL
ncbi:MAG: DUF3596 domain-containing protein [Ignavibacterium sp.]|jgi:hypothetical protein|uniref:Arm DNA-binding domain-containing protein n=1 Tax=Ignavibacterium sp. TaxID=2651167 RepID=UPI0032971573